MIRKIVAGVLMLAGVATFAQADEDICEGWTHKAYPVHMEACSYPNGGSGYTRITNNGNTAAAICWTVVTNSGREINGCNSNMDAGETNEAACASCGHKNGGVQYILLQKYEAR